jgi:peptidoglycan/LPS O-acetylase OafA/YrhL
MFGLVKQARNANKLLWLLCGGSVLLAVFSKSLPQPSGFHYSGVGLMAGTLFVFSLVLLLTRLKVQDHLSSLIETLGKYSFGVYVFHFILLEYLLKVWPSIRQIIFIYPVQFYFLYLAVCYGLCLLFDIISRRKFSYLVK